MKALRYLICVLTAAGVLGCSSSPPIRYFSLDDGESPALGSETGPRIAIVRVKVPESVDRSQMVVRTSEHELKISDQEQWAEPLRHQIPRLLARDLGVALDSGRVVTLPADLRNFEVDFKLSVDVQRLEVVLGRGVELDAIWRVEAHDGHAFFGRTRVWESIVPGTDTYASVVASQRLAFLGLARQLAKELAKETGGGSPTAGAGDENPVQPGAAGPVGQADGRSAGQI